MLKKNFNALQKAWFTVLLNGYSCSTPHHTSQQQSDRIKRIAKMVSWWLILPAHLKQWRQETKLRWPVCCLQLPHSQYRSVPVTGLGPPESRYRAPPSDTDRKSCLEKKVYDLDSQEDLSVTSLLLNSDTSPSPRWNYTLTEVFDVFTPWSQVPVLVIRRKRVWVL